MSVQSAWPECLASHPEKEWMSKFLRGEDITRKRDCCRFGSLKNISR